MSDLPNLDLVPVEPTQRKRLTVDEFLGKTMTVEEFLAPPRVELFGARPPMDYFMEGWKQGVGTEPFGEHSTKLLREAGILSGDFQTQLGEIKKNDLTLMRAFNNALIAPAAAGLETAMRLGMGAVYGFSRELEAYGLPRDLTPAALLEAFPVGRGTGLPTRPQSLTPALRIDLDAAERLGVFGESAPQVALRSLEPEQPLRISSAGQAEGQLVPGLAAEAPLRPVDINEVARLHAPEVFERYDALAEQRRVLDDTLAEMKANDPVVIAARANIDEILGRVNGVENRLTQRAARRLEESRDVLDEALRRDSPEQNAIRLQRVNLDADLRALAPEVSAAYRTARDTIPAAEQLEVLRRDLAPENVEIRSLDDGTFEVETPRGIVAAANENEAIAIARREGAGQAIGALAQRAPTIRQQVLNDLRAAGRTFREAEAAAMLVAERYASRGERLGIPAQDLFDRDFPSISRGGESRNRGMYRTATNELVLFDKADASTFIHEMGHRWFKEFSDDAKLPDAPADLVRDFEVAREWLREAGGERAQQEMWARGFERYLMEGVAPSSRLARVFEQFRDWLTRIYQTVTRLRAPINDDIRGVYDRLISTPNRDPVIAGTRDRESIGAISEDLANEAPMVDSAEAANTVRGLRDRLAENLSPEIADARREALRGPERISVPRPEGEGAGPGTGGQAAAPRITSIGEGRVAASGKGAEVQPDGRVVTSNDFVNAQGEIILENLLEAADVKQALRLASETTALNVPRRGILSDAETLRLAEEMGMRPRDIDRRAVGEAFNAEQVTAAIKLYRQSDLAVRDAMAKAAVGDIESIKDYALARERHIMIMEQMAGVRAEAGRALRAFRQLGELKELEQLNEFFQKSLGRNLSELRQEAELGAKLQRPDQMAVYTRRIAQKSIARKGAEGIMEAWIAGLFSGWETHVFNILGSTIPLIGHVVETAGAATIARLLGSRAAELSEVGDLLMAIKDSAKQAAIASGKALWDENFTGTTGPLDKYTKALPSVTVNVLGVPIKLGGSTVRFPLRLLTAEDLFFKTIAKNQALYQIARRTAREEGFEGAAQNRRAQEIRENPTEAMLAAAEEFARYQTFQKGLGSKGRVLQQITEEHPFARLVFPVVKTGFNLLKYAGERSPFGFAMREVRDRMFDSSNPAAQYLQASRMAIGTAFMTATFAFVLEDLMTGGGPTTPAERETQRAAGRQPYSARLGDMWIDFRRLSPLGNQMMMAADLAEISRHVTTGEDKDNLEKAVAMVGLSFWRNVGDSLALRGASDLMEAVQDYRRYGGHYMNRMAGTVIPNFVTQTGALFDDPVMRDTYSLIDTMKARLGMRTDLAVVRDRWGEPVPFTPGVRMMRDNTSDPVNAEMLRLGVNPARPLRKWGDVELTPQQYDDYTRIAGRLAKQRLDQMIATPAWRTLPDGLQRKEISDLVSSSRKHARTQIIFEYPELIKAKMDEKLKELE